MRYMMVIVSLAVFACPLLAQSQQVDPVVNVILNRLDAIDAKVDALKARVDALERKQIVDDMEIRSKVWANDNAKAPLSNAWGNTSATTTMQAAPVMMYSSSSYSSGGMSGARMGPIRRLLGGCGKGG